MRRALFLPLLLACLAAAPDPRAVLARNPAAGKVLEVPFIPQGEYDCGPVALAMGLRWQGLDADPAALNEKFRTNAVAGVFTVDLLIAATQAGAEAHWVAGTMESLRAELDAGRPPVVFLNLRINPLPARHFALAVGYLRDRGRDYVILHSGASAFLAVPQKTFLRQWGRTGRQMLTIARTDGPKP